GPNIDRFLDDVKVVLHCAGPYIHTFKPMVEACLRTHTHYLDLTGEIPVYEGIAALDGDALRQGVMLLPGVGFDVVPTDCLALHLKQRLPSATRLTLAFRTQGPGGLPPGTQRTMIELLPYGNRVRRNGQLEVPERGVKTRMIDFGDGPVEATRLTWGDVFMAYHSTGIPDIEDYALLPESARRQMAKLDYLRPLFRIPMLRALLKRGVRPGPSAEQRARTITHVWGEVEDDRGSRATARLHGPEAGVVWTGRAALAAVRKVLSGNAPEGFQTPAKAYGADFVLECEGVTREDVIAPR
ncbi:MAG: saccharopine dehydrogenase, partial [Acidobacteriota bacterium]|nr:saccharopine dehydrogenase [Acidobacteriota bacterium]